MKKYIPIDFDEKGKVVLGREKDTPTSNGFIPTTWAPGGSGEAGNGIKSISISPAITTTPAFASLFPIYWEDLTEEQKQEHAVRFAASTQATMEVGDTYTVTVVPTADIYAMGDSEFGGKGEPVTLICEVTDFTDGNAMEIEIVATNQVPPSANAMYFSVILRIG